MKVANKVWVVTGAGSGMGREITLQLLAKKSRVAMVDVNEKGMEETARLSGSSQDHLAKYTVNIADRNAVFSLPEKVKTALGNVDGIINNAGIIQPFVKINDLELDAVERVMNVNFYGTLYMVKAFLPSLLERPQAHIVNISSMGGFLPVPGQTIYGASKAAVKLLTEGLHAELRDSSVKVTVVFPGAVNTNISENSGLTSSMGSESAEESSFNPLAADKAADLIISGIENDKYRVLVGKDARMMDRISRLSPKGAANLIYRKMKSLLSDV